MNVADPAPLTPSIETWSNVPVRLDQLEGVKWGSGGRMSFLFLLLVIVCSINLNIDSVLPNPVPDYFF